MKDLLISEQLEDFGREAATCGLCKVKDYETCMSPVWKPNPYGAWRGEVISHWECKDKEACAQRRQSNCVEAK